MIHLGTLDSESIERSVWLPSTQASPRFFSPLLRLESTERLIRWTGGPASYPFSVFCLLFSRLSSLRLVFQAIFGVLGLNKFYFCYFNMEFSVRSMHKLIKGTGDKRVSEQTSIHLGELLERFAGDVAEEAVALAEEEGLQTVQRRHIKSALK